MDRNIFRYILRHSLKAQILILGMTVGSFPFLYATLELPKIIINDALAGNGPRTVLGITFSQVHYLFLLCGVFLALVLVNGGFKYVINLQWDVYQMGLRGTIDPEAQPELAGHVLEPRQAMREWMRDPKLGRLVERFHFARYNSNATLAENPIFGTPTEGLRSQEPRRPEVLIMYDATGPLDPAEQLAILDRLLEEFEQRTRRSGR